MSSDLEVKLVDLTNGGGDGFYYIPASDMPVNQWVTVDIPMSSFRGNDSMSGGPIAADHNIDQLVLKPMNNYDPSVGGPRETFYMDDMYFSGSGVGAGTDPGVDIGTDSGSDTDATPVELLADGSFADGTGWSGNALNIVDGVTRADVGQAGNPWDVNLSGAVVLTSGDDYTLVFEARGAEGRALKAGIGDAGSPYHNDVADLTLVDGWQTYTLHLTALDAIHGGEFTGAGE